MSILDEVSCTDHPEGYDSSCVRCNKNVALLASKDFPGGPGVPAKIAVVGLLVVASPSIAREAFYALGKAMQGKELTVRDVALLGTIRDCMQDCIGRLR